MKSFTNKKTKRVLVTGGAGFIGTHLVNRLLLESYEVIVIDSFNNAYDPTRKRLNLERLAKNFKTLTVIELDIRSIELPEIMNKYEPSTVIHLAAMTGVRRSLVEPDLYFDVNVRGTLNLLEAMRKNEVKHIILASSSSVYGNRLDGPFKETDVTDNQISPYGASKKAAELLCHVYASQFRIMTTCLRFFTVYGPGNRPDLACYKFMDALYHKKPLEIYGNGKSGRDYTYVDDIVSGVMSTMSGRWLYEIINLGNSRPIILSEMIKAFADQTGITPIINYTHSQPGDVFFTHADISKAQKLLSWKPRTPFDRGLGLMLKWYRNENNLDFRDI